MSFLQCIKPKIDGDMENHPLNMAHQQQRRAESHLKHNRYEEALQCHHNAAELLLDAMKSTSSTVALESISLQHSYHLKQKDLIESKKEQYVRVKKAMDAIKNMSKDPNIDITDAAKIQVAIYKNINESETLLSKLSLNQEMAVGETSDPKEVKEAKKKEKSQQVVIEELQILSQNLHALVEQLVLQVEVLKDENATFKERVNYLEKERIRYLNIITEEDRHPSLTIKNKYFIDSPSKEPGAYMNVDFNASKGNE